MQNDPNDRSLNGKEREQERIQVKRLEVAKKKFGLEIETFKNQKEGLDVEIEAREKQLVDLLDRIEKGKKLIGGAKIKDIFPPEEPEEKSEEKKQDGGEKGEGKI